MRWTQLTSRTLVVASVGLFFSACNGSGGLTGAAPQTPLSYQPASHARTTIAPARHRASRIQHVVIIIQENRSFNNLFYGFKGATTVQYGYDTSGQRIRLEPVVLETTWDLGHNSWAFFDACNGTGSIPGTACRMNGFNQEGVGCGQAGHPVCPIEHPQYAYVPHYETVPYFAMGEEYVLADQMYASNFDASSFTSHQYIIAAQSESSVNFPTGFPWGCAGGSGNEIPTVGPDRQITPYSYEQACFSDNSLGQEADKAGISWAFYAGNIYGNGGDWSAYQANKYVYYGSDWASDVITPQTQFFSDVSNGKLRQISWITPTDQNSDHPGGGSNTGPSWVASLVNAIGESKYWDSTAIFIFWDEYGGWYDPEPPAYVDNDGLGMRIPLLVISAYAKKGHVSHVHYEHGSILKFVEDQFGLPRLAASDTRATSPEQDCFDFTQPPRPFQVIPSEYGKEYFLHQPPDYRPPDTQ
jgi:phospholipase C